MSFNFSLWRIALFLGVVGAYWLVVGFGVPELTFKANARMIGLFFVGAVCVSFIDHMVGNFPPSNLRFFYILLGVILIVAAGLWTKSLRHAHAPPPGESPSASALNETMPTALQTSFDSLNSGKKSLLTFPPSFLHSPLAFSFRTPSF